MLPRKLRLSSSKATKVPVAVYLGPQYVPIELERIAEFTNNLPSDFDSRHDWIRAVVLLLTDYPNFEKDQDFVYDKRNKTLELRQAPQESSLQVESVNERSLRSSDRHQLSQTPRSSDRKPSVRPEPSEFSRLLQRLREFSGDSGPGLDEKRSDPPSLSLRVQSAINNIY